MWLNMKESWGLQPIPVVKSSFVGEIQEPDTVIRRALLRKVSSKRLKGDQIGVEVVVTTRVTRGLKTGHSRGDATYSPHQVASSLGTRQMPPSLRHKACS
jgi:hypothetical protein